MISDRSTNGTYVPIGDDEELRLHRDELHLRKAGTISLGQAVAINVNDVIQFEAEPESRFAEARKRPASPAFFVVDACLRAISRRRWPDGRSLVPASPASAGAAAGLAAPALAL